MPRAPADPKVSTYSRTGRDPRLRPHPVPRVELFGGYMVHPTRSSSGASSASSGSWRMIHAVLLTHRDGKTAGVTTNDILDCVKQRFPNSDRKQIKAGIKRAVDHGKLQVVQGTVPAYKLPYVRQGPTPRQSTANKSRTAGVSRGKRAANGETSNEVRQGNSGEGKWVWQYQDGGWHDYYPKASDEVEATYQVYLKEKAAGKVVDVRAVKSGQWEYQVDFRQLTQQNIQHEAHTIRNIRRICK